MLKVKQPSTTPLSKITPLQNNSAPKYDSALKNDSAPEYDSALENDSAPEYDSASKYVFVLKYEFFRRRMETSMDGGLY